MPFLRPACVVQKFGGTSLGKYSQEIIDNAIRPYALTSKVVAVCSARSLDTKLGGTTSRLLRACQDALSPTSKHYQTLLREIQEYHIDAVDELVISPVIARRLTRDIQDEFDQIGSLFVASQTLGEITPRCLDRVLSIGEKLSAKILAALLQDQGISAQYVDLSDLVPLVDNKMTGAGTLVLDQEFYDHMSMCLSEAVQACPATVTVVTGFFGQVPGGLLSQVGRGYTDLCAVLLAAGIPGAELQIWKELDGIYTADPRRVKAAAQLRAISPDEAAELTFFGSEVIHPSAMRHALHRRIPISVKGVLNAHGRGTRVDPHLEADSETDTDVDMDDDIAHQIGTHWRSGSSSNSSADDMLLRSSTHSSTDSLESPVSPASESSFSTATTGPTGPTSPATSTAPTTAPTSALSSPPLRAIAAPSSSSHGMGVAGHALAVTTKRSAAVLRILPAAQILTPDFLAAVLTTLEKWRLGVDLLAASDARLVLALHSRAPQLLSDNGDAEAMLDRSLHGASCDLQCLAHRGAVEFVREVTLVSVIGRGMRGALVTVGDMLRALGEGCVRVEMVSQGTSDVSTSFMIKEKDVERSVNILHDLLFLPDLQA